MKLILFVGLILGTGYLATILPWWALIWLSLFWIVSYGGALKGAWAQTLKEAQAAASTAQLSKDADDTTPLNIVEVAPVFIGFAVVVAVGTALLVSLLWFGWS